MRTSVLPMVLPVVLLLVADPHAAAQPVTPATAANVAPLVIGETFTISSRVLGEVRRINVYAPPGTNAAEAPPLPVLYMPDGGIAEDFQHVAGLLQVSVGNGTMRPFLLVGIENTDRRRDMTGPTSSPGDRRVAPRAGGSEKFRQFIRTELMPIIEARHRTSGETAIVGESMAGLFVVETFLVEPSLFDTYIAFDPSLWWDDERLVKTAARQLRAATADPRTLYLASSSEPGLASLTLQFVGALRTAGTTNLTWHHLPMPEETHATIYHPAALRAFRTLFAPSGTK